MATLQQDLEKVANSIPSETVSSFELVRLGRELKAANKRQEAAVTDAQKVSQRNAKVAEAAKGVEADLPAAESVLADAVAAALLNEPDGRERFVAAERRVQELRALLEAYKASVPAREAAEQVAQRVAVSASNGVALLENLIREENRNERLKIARARWDALKESGETVNLNKLLETRP